MSEYPNIHDYGPIVQGPGYVTPTAKHKIADESKGGLSDIEKSKAVAALMILLPNFPILSVPRDDQTFGVVIGTMVVGSSKSGDVAKFLAAQQLKLAEITNQMLDSWSKNIHDMKEEADRIASSPLYQELQLIRVRGDPKQGNVSGVETATAANSTRMNPAAANVDPLSLISAIDRLHAFERVPPSATIPDPSDPTDSTKTLTIPLVAAMFMGGALALGSVEMSTTMNGIKDSPLFGTVELVERLQPILPQLLQDVIPMINLMVMPLIYYTSWDNAVGSLRNKEGANNLATIQDFAKQVIKMVSDPAFILTTIVNKMEGADALSPERKNILASILKLILSTVAISLLYSFDAGKVQNEEFWGMEPQELQGMISGTIPMPDPSDSKLTTQGRLAITLLELIRAQLDVIPAADKANVLGILFDYLPNKRNLKEMLDPSKIFRDVFNSTLFNLGIAGLETNPA